MSMGLAEVAAKLTSTMTDKREFDLIIFGASGLTGYFVVRELLLSIDDNAGEYASLKWAVAGKNLSKLTEKLETLGEELNKDLSSTVKIEANVNNVESLEQMAKRAKLVLNVVGPNKLFGRQVVEACVYSGTHHLSVSSGTFVAPTQFEYDSIARTNGALIISTCGWSSIPSDVGVDFLKKNFDGKLHSVESYLQILPGSKGYRLNFYSAIDQLNGFFEYLKMQARKSFANKVLPSRLPLRPKLIPEKRPEMPGWNIYLPGYDKLAIERTQLYNFEHFNEPPAQIQTYFNVGKFLHVIAFILQSLVVAPASLFSAGLYLLEQYPEKFTLGYVSKQGPSREQIDSTRTLLYLLGKGWSKESIDDTDTEPLRPLDKAVTVAVSGRDPAYMATAICAIQAALTVLLEAEKMPKGGVLTPASAFRNTKLVERLESRDLKFKIIVNNIDS